MDDLYTCLKCGRLRQEKDSLEEKVKAGDELNTSLRQRLESSINRADDLQRTLDGQKEVLTILRSGGNDSDSSGRILEITERIEQIRKTAQEREAQLNSQIEKLKEQSYEAVRRLADAEQQRDEAVSVAGTAANQVKQIRDEFSTRIAQLISQRDRAIARNNEKMQAHYDAMLKRYEYSAAELKRENARLSLELSSAASGNSQSEADNAEQQRFLVEAREIVASAIEERDHAIARNNERIQARIDSLIADNNRKNAELLREIDELKADSASKSIDADAISALTGERDRAVRNYEQLAQSANAQIQNVQKEYQVRMQKVQEIVGTMQEQNARLQQTVTDKNNQLKQMVEKYNALVEELGKRQNIITELRSKLKASSK